ncbi:MAG TPA: NAD kinase [Saprospiraceae bacterium]|nr:NAD kinase [Saprospiraceae bacterium]
MQVVVFGRTLKENDTTYVQTLMDVLQEEGIYVYIYRPYLESLESDIRFRKDVGVFEGFLDFSVKKFDFVITLGGDGTILDATTFVRDSGVPIIGINLGRLGFLASIEKVKIKEAIRAIAKGMYWIDERSLLQLESNLPVFEDISFALNDCTLLKRETSSMISTKVFINGDLLNTYWADGIIISTPTGSTGYSLSCGGPIVFPNSGNFVITPVAPHNLNVRPIVISDDSVISFELEGRSDNFLCTLDSRFESITPQHQIAVRKADFTIKLAQLNDRSFLDTLKEKLVWGVDVRN